MHTYIGVHALYYVCMNFAYSLSYIQHFMQTKETHTLLIYKTKGVSFKYVKDRIRYSMDTPRVVLMS